jgi:hypothetical protein
VRAIAVASAIARTTRSTAVRVVRKANPVARSQFDNGHLDSSGGLGFGRPLHRFIPAIEFRRGPGKVIGPIQERAQRAAGRKAVSLAR